MVISIPQVLLFVIASLWFNRLECKTTVRSHTKERHTPQYKTKSENGDAWTISPPFTKPKDTIRKVPEKKVTVQRTNRREGGEKVRVVTTNVAICAVVRDEDLYINDWIDYHLLLGFNTIYLFDNSRNGSAKIAYLPQYYEKTVKVTHAPGDGIQLKIYNLFVQHIGRREPTPMWVAFIDVDEYIVLRKHTSIKSFLSAVTPKGGAVVISRMQYGSNGQIKYENKPVLSRFTTRKTAPESTFKSIVYLPDLLSVQQHTSVLRNGSYAVNPCGYRVNDKHKVCNTSISIASINHYYTKSMEEYRSKRLRGSALDAHLNTQYNTTLHSDNLILTEFIVADAGANAVEDTFAWDFYKGKLSEK